jgi:hypothetical protein
MEDRQPAADENCRHELSASSRSVNAQNAYGGIMIPATNWRNLRFSSKRD